MSNKLQARLKQANLSIVERHIKTLKMAGPKSDVVDSLETLYHTSIAQATLLDDIVKDLHNRASLDRNRDDEVVTLDISHGLLVKYYALKELVNVEPIKFKGKEENDNATAVDAAPERSVEDANKAATPKSRACRSCQLVNFFDADGRLIRNAHFQEIKPGDRWMYSEPPSALSEGHRYYIALSAAEFKHGTWRCAIRETILVT